MKCSIGLSILVIAASTAGVAAQVPAAPMPSAPAPAGTSAPAVPSSVGPAKIAVIAFQVAVTRTNEFQRAFLDLEKKYEPKRQSLKTMSDQIDSLTKELQATDSKLTDQDKADKARQLDEKKKQFDREQQDDQSDFSQEVQGLFQQTGSKVDDLVATYAQQHGFTLVLDIASRQNPVLYAPPAIDITNEVIAAYNIKSGVPAPVPAAAKPATTPKAPTAKPGAKSPAKPPSK